MTVVKKIFFHALMCALITLPLFASPALAKGSLKDAFGNNSPLADAGQNAGTGDLTLQGFVGTAINTALSLVGIIFLILMVYAGYLWMTARGEEGQVEKAQSIIQRSVIGLVIVMSAYAITTLITTRIEQG